MFARALQACHQRGEVHITARELRATISYVFFGIHTCAELHADPALEPERFWDRAFDPRSPGRQGDLLAELTRLDPALEGDAALDRELLRVTRANGSGTTLPEARRRFYFEDAPEGTTSGPQLAASRHWERFLRLPLAGEDERRGLCRDLCAGIARLEDVPAIAFEAHRDDGIPIRIPPRTPTESCFWVVKPWHRFRVEPTLSRRAPGLETLHTHLDLVYSAPGGQEERLTMGLEMFHLLLELKDGVQLSGAGQEGIFDNLDIFSQRLAAEEVRSLMAWHPSREEVLMRVTIQERAGQQILSLETAT